MVSRGAAAGGTNTNVTILLLRAFRGGGAR